MPTVEDILSNSDHVLINEPLFVIDSNLRVVSIPSDGVVAGVVGDKLVNFIDFKMPKTYNGFDMSTFSIRIDYVNANGEASYNNVTNYSVDGDYLYFSWLIDSHVTAYSGNVMFSARLFKQENGALKQCFNTSVGNIKVLDGIIAEEQISYDEQRQIISDIIQEVTDYFIKNPTGGSVSDDHVNLLIDKKISPLSESIVTINEDLNDLKEQIGQGSESGSGVSKTMVDSLYALLEKCAFVSDDVTKEVDAFKSAWGISGEVIPTLTGITVVWLTDNADVGTNPNTLISSVKANYSDGSQQTVTGYTVTPAILAEGAQTVIVAYHGKTASKQITGTASAPKWEEPFTLSYAQSTSPATNNNFMPVKTTNTGYSNGCFDTSEHYGGVLHVDVTDSTIGFDMALIYEKADGERGPLKADKSFVSENNSVVNLSYEGTALNYISTKSAPGISYTVVIPADCKIAAFFRNMSNKADVIGQNGVTFTLKSE